MKEESKIIIGGINNTDDSWIVFDDDGHFRHEVKYDCGGKKVHLHFTITELADPNKDPNNVFFDFELDADGFIDFSESNPFGDPSETY